MNVGSGLPRNPRCAASGVEGQAATGGGGLSDWQAERRLRRRGASGAEPGRSGARCWGSSKSGKVAAPDGVWTVRDGSGRQGFGDAGELGENTGISVPPMAVNATHPDYDAARAGVVAGA